MSDNLFYREGFKDDLKQIRELAVISYRQYANVLNTENWEKLNISLNSESTFSDIIEKSIPFVCTDNDTIVGMAFFYPHGNPTDIYQDNWCYIRMVGVHPHYSGRGIGRKLTMMCIEKAKDLHEKTIALHTSEFMDAARHIYESIGFKVLKEIPQRLGKRYWVYTLDI
jgi:ribosomal protein S18 acetylase RimI-like enzyme